jgi:hypothetical protein
MYLQYIYGVFECMHSIFECTYNTCMVYFNVPIIYFNAFIVCFNVFQCVWNVFIDIVIEFHHHFLIVTFLPCTPTYTFFFHSIQWLPSQHAIPLRSFFSIPVDPFQLSYNLPLLFTSIHHPTFHIPHSMSSLVARSIAEPMFSLVFFSNVSYIYIRAVG